MYSGKCLCGGIEITITGPIDSIIHCHCSLCRKSSGTAYATNGFVHIEDFHIEKGADTIKRYDSAPGKGRYFCNICGTPIYSAKEIDPNRVRLRIGLLDSDISEKPISHNFVSSKASWDDLENDLPQYDGFEPGR